MTITPRKKTLLLDLDGTVVDTHELIYQCYDQTMREHCGCQGRRQILQQCGSFALARHFYSHLEALWCSGLRPALTEAIAIYRGIFAISKASVSTFPGMSESLIELVKRGWRLGIVTTKPREAEYRHLQSTRTDAAHSQSSLPATSAVNLKPHPEPFLKAPAGTRHRLRRGHRRG